jgi:phage terminase large subunit
MAEVINIETPEKFERLFEAARYKVLYGGRGGAKSWNIARILLALGRMKPLRILCARELQVSIADSVHKLLADQVKALSFDDHYKVLQTSILGKNGTEFSFIGIQKNTNKIKSYEGVDIVWIEEAATVSKASWDFLIPTIRKAGSEIWMSFNPELTTDETYKRFILDPPLNALVIPVSYRDNPWFPKELEEERLRLKKADPVSYRHIWEGECRSAQVGAIYGEQLESTQKDGRFTDIKYDSSKPVLTFWDLGFRDNTAIWFIQRVGNNYNIIDFYQNSLKALPFYLAYLQRRPYIYGTHYLPHDGKKTSYDTGKVPEDYFRELGWKDIYNGIESTRYVLSRCTFNEDACADGIQALRQYAWDEKKESKRPRHDAFSHAADAFRTFGTASFVQWDNYAEQHAPTTAKVLSEWDPLEMAQDSMGRYVMNNS